MRQFFILWIGQLLSDIGSEITGFALGIWVYQQTQSATLYAMLMGLYVLPSILLSPVVGAVTDRWNRRWVMLASDFGAGLTTVALAIVLYTNTLPISLIAILITLNAVCGSFMAPAYMAATTQLVAEKDLDRASGMTQLGSSIGQLAAPVLGGLLLYEVGLTGILILDIITFFIAVITQAFIRIPPIPKDYAPTEGSLLKNFWQGFKFLQKHPGLSVLLMVFVIKNFVMSIAYVATTPYILSFSSEVVLGSIFSIGGIGMLLGSLVLSIFPMKRSRIRSLIVFCLLGGVTLVALGFSRTIWAFMLGSFLFFLGTPFIYSAGQVIFQKQVPQALQGRVFAFNDAVAGGSIPLGYAIAGPLGEYIFEPLMQPDGLLSGSVGQLLGVGPGRGIALLFVCIGIVHGALGIFAALYPPLYYVEQRPLKDPLKKSSDSPSSHTPSYSPPSPDSIPTANCNTMLHTPDLNPSELDFPSVHGDGSPRVSSPLAPIISIQNLNYFYGKGELAKQILFDLYLDIYPGEIVIMTGPSGSGKTTLLTLVGALRAVNAGSIQVLGHELNNATNKQRVQVRRNIGYIFQGHNLLPFMSAYQNVKMSLSLRKHSDSAQALSRVDEVLEAVGLGDRADQHPGNLSGGQKQRVAIARALVNQPALILADEPTASLDSKTGRDVVELMYRLAKEQNRTILLVTHDNRILDIADRIVHLEDGKLQSVTGQVQPPEQTHTRSDATVLALSSAEAAASNMLSTAFSDEGYKAVVPAVPNTLENSRCTVACISNSSTTLNDLKTYLSDEVFSVISIQDSVKALTEIVRLNPDIIIADARLEKINGYQLCELLRQHPSFKAVPVFLMLDESDQIGSKKVCRSGITETLVKPFNQTSLIVKLFPYLGEWPGSKKADLG